jgi:tetratricopeptide (TPR) repeat protein
MTTVVRRSILVLGAAVLIPACATAPPVPAPDAAPRYPDFPVPVVPDALEADPALRSRHEDAWRRLQAGDLSGAARDFEAVLAADPAFFPAETGLGYAHLARSDFAAADARFAVATGAAPDYLPAWRGLVRARLGLGDDEGAITVIERVLALDPTETALRSQLDLLQFRHLQGLIEAGRTARASERFAESVQTFERALALSPTSAVLHRELAVSELARGGLDSAERHAMRAIELDDSDAEAHAVLATILERRGRDREAADAYARAASLDPRPEWTERSASLGTRADLVVIPEEFRAVPTAPTVTRAQVAAFIGIRLEDVLERAPRSAAAVATDVQGHWAAPWILPVTQAGIMDIFPNHTFEPADTVRRGDLAQIVERLLALNPMRRMDLLRWRQLRPEFADLPASNLFYPAAALAVSAEAMSLRAGNRFEATEPASGQDLVDAIERIEQILGG